VRGINFDASHNIYFTEQTNHVIRKIDINTGIISTIAGNGSAGDSGYDGLATSSLLNQPIDLVFDSSYNLYFGTLISSVINKIDTSGIMTKIAGTGSRGFSGDGGQASQATLNYVAQLCLYQGNLYFIDGINNRIRKIDFSTGIITTVVGTGLGEESGDGGQATLANLSFPRGLIFDITGNMFIADLLNVRKVDTNGIITTIVGQNANYFNYSFGQSFYLSFDSLGNLLITNFALSLVKVDFINSLTRDYNIGLSWSSYSNNTTFTNRSSENCLSFTSNSTLINNSSDYNSLISMSGIEANSIFNFPSNGAFIGLTINGYFIPDISGIWTFKFTQNDEINVFWFDIETPTNVNGSFYQSYNDNSIYTTPSLNAGQKYKFDYSWGNGEGGRKLVIDLFNPNGTQIRNGTGYYFHY
jgi:hypothetical protein